MLSGSIQDVAARAAAFAVFCAALLRSILLAPRPRDARKPFHPVSAAPHPHSRHRLRC